MAPLVKRRVPPNFEVGLCPIPAIDRRHPDRLRRWKCVMPGFVWRVMTGAPNRSLAA
jgi:hypothetical protein